VENLKKYESNPYMVSRLTNILTAKLPQVLANTEKQYNERQQRIQDLTTIQDGFIQRFYPPTIYFTARRPSSSLLRRG
jgi:hypothetical protein